jgi:outer membrane protein assembly factor BamB
MVPILIGLLSLAMVAAVPSLTLRADEPLNWPQFRGPTGQGHATGAILPIRWSEEEHIAWKTSVEGAGHSSPVIWGRQVWVTTSSRDGKTLGAVGLDRDTGDVLHSVVVFRPDEVQEIHKENSYASPTPVIEAERLYVHFGRYGTAGLDTTTGEVLWRNRDHVIEHQGGPGSSPVLFEDLLIFPCDGADRQYVVALDKQTGRERWRQERSAPQRDDVAFRRAFSTPLIVNAAGRWQALSVGADQLHAYDPATGAELWHVRYVGFSNVPAPVAADGMAYFCTGYYGPECWAVRMDGQGDVTETHVVWRFKTPVPDTPSPLLVGDRVFLLSDKGVAAAVHRKTGERVWIERLGGNYAASPLTDGRHLYFCSKTGLTKVYSLDDPPQLIATNKLDGGIRASPAVSGNALFIRTDSGLYRIEESAAASPPTSRATSGSE